MGKIYVDVTAEFTKDGILRPKSIRWEDNNLWFVEGIDGTNHCE